MDNHKKNGSCKKQSVICNKCNTWVPSIPQKFRQHTKNCKGEEEREVVEHEVEEQVVEEQEIEEQEVEEQALEVVEEQEIELDMDEELNGRRQEAPDPEIGRQEEQKEQEEEVILTLQALEVSTPPVTDPHCSSAQPILIATCSRPSIDSHPLMQIDLPDTVNVSNYFSYDSDDIFG